MAAFRASTRGADLRPVFPPRRFAAVPQGTWPLHFVPRAPPGRRIAPPFGAPLMRRRFALKFCALTFLGIFDGPPSKKAGGSDVFGHF